MQIDQCDATDSAQSDRERSAVHVPRSGLVQHRSRPSGDVAARVGEVDRHRDEYWRQFCKVGRHLLRRHGSSIVFVVDYISKESSPHRLCLFAKTEHIETDDVGRVDELERQPAQHRIRHDRRAQQSHRDQSLVVVSRLARVLLAVQRLPARHLADSVLIVRPSHPPAFPRHSSHSFTHRFDRTNSAATFRSYFGASTPSTAAYAQATAPSLSNGQAAFGFCSDQRTLSAVFVVVFIVPPLFVYCVSGATLFPAVQRVCERRRCDSGGLLVGCNSIVTIVSFQ